MGLHTIEVGAENPQTIVFLHGALVAGWMWRAQLNNLSDTFHCLAPDLPAHGDSTGIYSLENAVNAVTELIREKAHDGKAYLVGLSLGGLVALEVVSQHPDLIHRAIVSAPPSGPMPGTSVLVNIIPFALPLMRSNFAIRRIANILSLDNRDYETFRNQSKIMMNRNLMTTIARELDAHRLPENLHNSSIPTLAVVGEKDFPVSYQVARRIVERMPHAKGGIAPNGGHGWNGENPDLFNRMIRDWFGDGTIPADLPPLSTTS